MSPDVFGVGRGTSRQVDTDREDNFNAFVPSSTRQRYSWPRRTRGSIDRYDRRTRGCTVEFDFVGLEIEGQFVTPLNT